MLTGAEDPAGPGVLAWSTCPRRPGVRACELRRGLCSSPRVRNAAGRSRSSGRALGIPGSAGRGEPAVPSRACLSASTCPSCAPGFPPGRCREVWGSARASSFALLPRDRCKHCPPRGGRRTAAAGVCRLAGYLNAPTGRGGPELCPSRRGPSRLSSGIHLRLLPHCVRKLSHYSFSARLGRCCGVPGTEG